LNGPTVFKGYHKAPPSSDVFDSNGWFRTGDIVRFEKGLFYLVDRKKELIKYKGNQVALAELEGFLLSHPQILDAAVIGVASKGTEVPKAYVVARDGDVSAEHILSFIKERVSNHKQLRGGVVFVDQIPKSPSGKILRRVLKDMSRADSKAKGAKL
jgi:4-coumarate--CoA ligase